MKGFQKQLPLLALALIFLAYPGQSKAAESADANQAGEKKFKRCAVCHSIEEGKRKIGPSLYKIIGRQAGTVPDYKYSPDYVEAGEKGLQWTPENLIAYLEDPKKFLANFLNKDTAKSRMVIKFRQKKLREEITAYLQSLQK